MARDYCAECEELGHACRDCADSDNAERVYECWKDSRYDD